MFHDVVVVVVVDNDFHIGFVQLIMQYLLYHYLLGYDMDCTSLYIVLTNQLFLIAQRFTIIDIRSVI